MLYWCGLNDIPVCLSNVLYICFIHRLFCKISHLINQLFESPRQIVIVSNDLRQGKCIPSNWNGFWIFSANTSPGIEERTMIHNQNGTILFISFQLFDLLTLNLSNRKNDTDRERQCWFLSTCCRVASFVGRSYRKKSRSEGQRPRMEI